MAQATLRRHPYSCASFSVPIRRTLALCFLALLAIAVQTHGCCMRSSIRRHKMTPDQLIAAAKANGYRQDAFRETDINVQPSVKPFTKKKQESALNLYVTLVAPSPFHVFCFSKFTSWNMNRLRAEGKEPIFEETKADVLYWGAPAPSPDELKDFIRFMIATSRGRIAPTPSTRTIKTRLQEFYIGFTRVTGTKTNEDERSHMYRDVRTLVCSSQPTANPLPTTAA